jgi:hypothetical protein
MRRTTLAASLLILFCAAGPAAANPTAQVAGGRTTVMLRDEFVAALGALGVAAAPIGPATLNQRFAAFPIPGGALDLETARGDIFHTGGLSLSAGDTRVQLLNFVIDTQGDAPVLTGLVSKNGDLIARVPLFALTLNEEPNLWWSRVLIVRDVDVTLTAEAAGALNDIFGVSDFVEGFPIGEAVVWTKIVNPHSRGHGNGHGNGHDDKH